MTTQLAESGREAVGQVVDAMESINRGAGEVGEIIGVINEIAFQTNILALNAAVEAARAGSTAAVLRSSPPRCGRWPVGPRRRPTRSAR